MSLVRDAEVARSNRVAPIFYKCLIHNGLQRQWLVLFVVLGRILGSFAGFFDSMTLYVAFTGHFAQIAKNQFFSYTALRAILCDLGAFVLFSHIFRQ